MWILMFLLALPQSGLPYGVRKEQLVGQAISTSPVPLL
jgi:hypothetical protein